MIFRRRLSTGDGFVGKSSGLLGNKRIASITADGCSIILG